MCDDAVRGEFEFRKFTDIKIQYFDKLILDKML